MSVDSKMTAIADQIRTLQGGTDKLGLDAMATQIGAANSTVTAQASLITQIQAALEGKAAGGSGGYEIRTAEGTNALVPFNIGGTTYYSVVVSGLTFRPMAVVVGYNENAPSIFTINHGTILADANGVYYAVDSNNKGSQSASDSFAARCTVTNDGFVIPIGIEVQYSTQVRRWFAVGVAAK